MYKNKILLLLFLIFIFGFYLRTLYFKDLAVTFGYDQARDAISTEEIIHGHLKIQGPPSSQPGLYHGVFYYYTLIPGYLLGHGSPVVAAYWIALLNSLGTIIIFYLTYLMTRKTGSAIIAALLFAVSFEATQYAGWLSNPTLGVWTVPLAYLGIWVWLKEKKTLGVLIAAFGLGLSIQSEIFLIYHGLPLIFWMFVQRKNIKRYQLIVFVLTLLLTLSSMIIVQLRVGLGSIIGVAQLASSSDSIVQSRGLGDFLLLYFNQLGRVFAYNVYPGNIGYAGIFVLGLIIVSFLNIKKFSLSWQTFLPIWILCHLTVVSVGGTSTPFLLVGIGPAISMLVAIYIYKWFEEEKKVLAICTIVIIIIGNLSRIMQDNKNGQVIFAIQKDMLLRKQIELVEYTYQQAAGAPFSINTLTSPLSINIVWAYLYDWYGKEKYGYVPSFHGQDQIGQLISLPKPVKDTKSYFLILEPMEGIPPQYLEQIIGAEDGTSKLIEEKTYGELVVQRRTKL